MIVTKMSIFGFILSIVNSDVAGQTVLEAPSIGDNFYDICTSRECNDTASTILNNMDPKIEPCSDFYKFACGGFVEKAVIPPYSSSSDMQSITNTKINVALKSLIDAKIEDNETETFAKIKKFYKSCVNTTGAMASSGLEFLRANLNKLGGWPVVVGDTWDESQFDWVDLMSKLREIGDNANYFINYDIDIDQEDEKTLFIVLSRPFTESKDEFQNYRVNNRRNETKLQHITGIANIFGANASNVTTELWQTYIFEKKLYNIITAVDESPDADLRNRTTIAELNAMYTGVRWKDYINGILPTGVNVDDNDIIEVEAPSYFRKLIRLISVTSKRVLANYVFRKFVNSAMSLIIRTENLWDQPRWEKCLDIVKNKMPLIIGAMYVREYFTNETRSNVEEMITEIMHELNDTLGKSSWMTEATINAAIEKATAMNIRVGYPDELFNDMSLDEYHANLTITEDNYVANMFNISSFVHRNAYNVSRNLPMRTDWLYDSVLEVNAGYTPIYNAFRILAGHLRDIFYGKDRPEYLNYGAIGTLIGHEIGHGFDETGSSFDKDGNYRDWWDSTTKEEYNKRVDCFDEQYSNYTADEIEPKVTPTGTLNEIIADNIGLKLAYEAYVRRSTIRLQSSTFDEPRLNGLEKYPPRQMFWISFASSWCERVNKESPSSQVSDDEHPAAEYRVIGSIPNMPEFAKDFQCSKVLNSTNVSRSRMIPAKRCTVW